MALSALHCCHQRGQGLIHTIEKGSNYTQSWVSCGLGPFLGHSGSFAASWENQLHLCFGEIAAELEAPKKWDVGGTWSREKAAPQQEICMAERL